MIGIIDYGLGNLFSLQNSLNYLGHESKLVKNSRELRGCDHLILPGVGAFPEAVRKLKECDMLAPLKEWNKPLLGICLGMQLLFSYSEEFSYTEGLNLIPGKVVKITGDVKIPHMGWNTLSWNGPQPLAADVEENCCVYFVHSYHAVLEKKYLVATTDYSGPITAVAANGLVMGTQFHPEKSGKIGLKILNNFVDIK